MKKIEILLLEAIKDTYIGSFVGKELGETFDTHPLQYKQAKDKNRNPQSAHKSSVSAPGTRNKNAILPPSRDNARAGRATSRLLDHDGEFLDDDNDLHQV